MTISEPYTPDKDPLAVKILDNRLYIQGKLAKFWSESEKVNAGVNNIKINVIDIEKSSCHTNFGMIRTKYFGLNRHRILNYQNFDKRQ